MNELARMGKRQLRATAGLECRRVGVFMVWSPGFGKSRNEKQCTAFDHGTLFWREERTVFAKI